VAHWKEEYTLATLKQTCLREPVGPGDAQVCVTAFSSPTFSHMGLYHVSQQYFTLSPLTGHQANMEDAIRKKTLKKK
jgi:hypothetical protein